MKNKIYNLDCVEGIKEIETGSIDAILTDPPYLYLNHKLDIPFDEDTLFKEWYRVLKDDGMIAVFGRGVPCARWLVKLDEIGFKHKEDMVWDKSYCSSPLLPISRVHENFFIFAKGDGKVIKTKVPYLEMKGHDLPSMQQDIERLCTVFSNTESFKAVKDFLESNNLTTDGNCKDGLTNSSKIARPNRCVSVVNGVKNGMNEKTIVRSDFYHDSNFMKSGVCGSSDSAGSGNRCVTVTNAVAVGMNEKSIIKQTREHYNTIHPTQKPVALLNRILNLISKEGDLILDCFGGSGSTAEACMKSNRDFILFEIDKEYFELAKDRIERERDLFTF